MSIIKVGTRVRVTATDAQLRGYHCKDMIKTGKEFTVKEIDEHDEDLRLTASGDTWIRRTWAEIVEAAISPVGLITIGSKVTIVENGYQYSGYKEMATLMGLTEFSGAFNSPSLKDNDLCTVIAMHKHTVTNTMLVGVSCKRTKAHHIISVHAVKVTEVTEVPTAPKVVKLSKARKTRKPKRRVYAQYLVTTKQAFIKAYHKLPKSKAGRRIGVKELLERLGVQSRFTVYTKGGWIDQYNNGGWDATYAVAFSRKGNSTLV